MLVVLCLCLLPLLPPQVRLAAVDLMWLSLRLQFNDAFSHHS